MISWLPVRPICPSPQRLTRIAHVDAAVHPTHPAVAAHRTYTTLAVVEAKREKVAAREAAAAQHTEEIAVTELWKPFGPTLGLFVAAGHPCAALVHLM